MSTLINAALPILSMTHRLLTGTSGIIQPIPNPYNLSDTVYRIGLPGGCRFYLRTSYALDGDPILAVISPMVMDATYKLFVAKAEAPYDKMLFWAYNGNLRNDDRYPEFSMVYPDPAKLPEVLQTWSHGIHEGNFDSVLFPLNTCPKVYRIFPGLANG